MSWWMSPKVGPLQSSVPLCLCVNLAECNRCLEWTPKICIIPKNIEAFITCTYPKVSTSFGEHHWRSFRSISALHYIPFCVCVCVFILNHFAAVWSRPPMSLHSYYPWSLSLVLVFDAKVAPAVACLSIEQTFPFFWHICLTFLSHFSSSSIFDVDLFGRWRDRHTLFSFKISFILHGEKDDEL